MEKQEQPSKNSDSTKKTNKGNHKWSKTIKSEKIRYENADSLYE